LLPSYFEFAGHLRFSGVGSGKQGWLAGWLALTLSPFYGAYWMVVYFFWVRKNEGFKMSWAFY